MLSGENILDDVASHIGKSEAATVVFVGEPFVVHTEQVEDGGVEVVEVNAVFGGFVADFVGIAVVDAAFDTAASEPADHVMGVVVTAGFAAGLSDWEAAKFAAPDYECVFEETAGGHVSEECGDGFVGFAGELAVIALNIVMAVPGPLVFHAAGIDLDEADTAFEQSAGGEALAGEVIALGIADAVESLCLLSFGGEVEGFRGGGLHAVGEFEAFDPCGQFGVTFALLLVEAVELFEEVEAGALGGGSEVGRAIEVVDGITGWFDPGALEDTGKKAGAPVGGMAFGESAAFGIAHDDEAGEIGAFAAEPVGDPRADAGEAHASHAGIDGEEGG